MSSLFKNFIIKSHIGVSTLQNEIIPTVSAIYRTFHDEGANIGKPNSLLSIHRPDKTTQTS